MKGEGQKCSREGKEKLEMVRWCERETERSERRKEENERRKEENERRKEGRQTGRQIVEYTEREFCSRYALSMRPRAPSAAAAATSPALAHAGPADL